MSSQSRAKTYIERRPRHFGGRLGCNPGGTTGWEFGMSLYLGEGRIFPSPRSVILWKRSQLRSVLRLQRRRGWLNYSKSHTPLDASLGALCWKEIYAYFNRFPHLFHIFPHIKKFFLCFRLSLDYLSLFNYSTVNSANNLILYLISYSHITSYFPRILSYLFPTYFFHISHISPHLQGWSLEFFCCKRWRGAGASPELFQVPHPTRTRELIRAYFQHIST